MASLVWTESAQNDLIEIKEYISLDSPLQAALISEAIFTKAQVLLRFPEIGKPVPELQSKIYREIVFKKYRIIYRLQDDIIYILSVHHSARLLKNNPHFKDLFQ